MLSLRVRLIVIISLALALMFAIIALYVVYQDQITFNKTECERSELLASAIQVDINNRYQVAYNAVQLVAADKQVQQLFAERDRQGLLNLLSPVYDQMQPQVPQFHFHLPNSTSFLRLHLPQRFGDSLRESRPAVVAANKTHSVVLGIEEGIGGLGYRVVVPVVYEGIHRGTVEMGGEIGSHFLHELKESYGSDYFLYSRHTDVMFLAATDTKDRLPLADEVLAEVMSGNLYLGSAADHSYSIILIPLFDYDNTVVAYLKVVTDRSEILNKLVEKERNLALLLSGAIILTAALIIILLYANVIKPLLEIKLFLRKVAGLNFGHRLIVRGNDEIAEIKHNLNDTVGIIDKAMSELQTANKQTITILNSISALVYVIDINTYEVLFVNKYGLDIYGDIVGQTCWKALQKGQDGPCEFCYNEQLLEAHRDEGRQLIWENTSTYNSRHYIYRGSVINWFDGRLARLAIATDNTERKLTEDILMQSREWYRTLAEDIPSLICRFTPDLYFTYVNNAYCDFFGMERNDILGASLLNVLPATEQEKVLSSLAALTPENRSAYIENRNIAFDGSSRWVNWHNRAIFDFDGRLKEYLSIGEDITEQKQHLEQLEYLSLRDPLTGIYNKLYYESEIRRLEGGREYPVAIIVGDIDNLKIINDSHGHAFGDQALKDCVAILKSAVRKGDVLARVGGDEFVVVMPRTDQAAGEGVIDRVAKEMELYNRESGAAFNLNISLGLAIADSSAEQLADVYVQADRNMYRRKKERKKSYC
jgi:diguanylate cyclase (GGDEF)-like protein/PAS domain S-box-containing protein